MAPKILITGLNGYLAGRTAEAVLMAGYDVRGTVRRHATGDKVKDALTAMGYPEDRVDVVEVPDMTVPGAFDEAVQGCHAILHLAAPLGEIYGETTPPEIVRKTTVSTQGLLDSAVAHAGGGLASVVYMSSVAAMFEAEAEAEPRRHDETDWNKLAEVGGGGWAVQCVLCGEDCVGEGGLAVPGGEEAEVWGDGCAG